jgi:integrase
MLPKKYSEVLGNKGCYMPRLTKRFLNSINQDSANKDVTYWDDSLKGFGLRVQSGGTMSWIIMYRTKEGGRLRKLTIGKANKLTPEEARAEAVKKFAEIEKGSDPAYDKKEARHAIGITELCDLYLKDAENRIKASTLAMDKSRIERHVKPLLGNLSVKSVRLKDIEKFQNEVAAGKTAVERTEGRSGLTTGGRGVAARSVGMLGTIFEFAKRRGIIDTNPARGVKKFVDGKNKRFLSFEEIALLGKAIKDAEAERENPTGIAAIKALLLTGCRKNEILSLPWDWFDANARCIRFGDTKSGAQLRPLGAAAVDLIKAQPKFKDSRNNDIVWVFRSDRGDGHFVGLPKVLERICIRAGLKDITVHILRHTFAAVAAELGFSELTIAGLIGHNVPGVTARYAHVPDRALLTAADAVSVRVATALDGKAEENAVVLPI